ncbi:MAG: hypothetical protein MZV70_69305 [Desulfobacterales bacterium]|nr:hypothetical protein [Desulfobacterales bacterium]
MSWGLCILIAIAGTALAEAHSVAIPKGTKCEKLGPGSFKLTTPDGTCLLDHVLQADGQGPGGRGGCRHPRGLRDHRRLRHHATPKASSSPRATNGVLKAQAAKAAKGAPPTDYVKIDDEVTWLPAVIEFPSVRIFNRQALVRLSPQPDPPGKG